MIEMGIMQPSEHGWADQPLMTWVWENSLSFEGKRFIRAPEGSEPMILDTLWNRRLDAGLTWGEAEELGLEDCLYLAQPGQ